jgi:hypothetical protein
VPHAAVLGWGETDTQREGWLPAGETGREGAAGWWPGRSAGGATGQGEQEQRPLQRHCGSAALTKSRGALAGRLRAAGAAAAGRAAAGGEHTYTRTRARAAAARPLRRRAAAVQKEDTQHERHALSMLRRLMRACRACSSSCCRRARARGRRQRRRRCCGVRSFVRLPASRRDESLSRALTRARAAAAACLRRGAVRAWQLRLSAARASTRSAPCAPRGRDRTNNVPSTGTARLCDAKSQCLC